MRIVGVVCAATLAAVLTACSGSSADRTAGSSEKKGSSSSAQDGAGAASSGTLAVKASDTELGTILTDQTGRTLYAFTSDKGNTSSCSDSACIATWPALAGTKAPVAGSGIKASMLGTTKRAEGTTQATYNGWPLYYYAADAQPGDTDGQGVDGEWFVVNAADGTQLRAGQ